MWTVFSGAIHVEATSYTLAMLVSYCIATPAAELSADRQE
jgi:hypothetical protein